MLNAFDQSQMLNLQSAFAPAAQIPQMNAMRARAEQPEPQTGNNAFQAAAIPSSSSDRDLLAKTLMAEAGGEGFEGMLAAGAVIANRARLGRYGDGVSGVIMKPGQFSSWNGVTGYAGGQGAINMAGIKANADAYKATDLVLSGQYDDPTGGATHYYNPAAANPAWGQQRAGGDWKRIGNHIFGFADGDAGAAKQRTPEPAMPSWIAPYL